MDGLSKLCVLDGVSRRWIMDEMKETPEEIIDYVMPISLKHYKTEYKGRRYYEENRNHDRQSQWNIE